MKDLIIGAASNYGWNDVKYWVNSIRASGFTGDVALVGTNIKKEDIDLFTESGIILSLYGERNERGDVLPPKNGLPPHVERFFYLWKFLNETKEKYRFVITTDTRDVVFQTNPSKWLDGEKHGLVASSEGMKYKDEPWGNKNLLETFGPYFHASLKENNIYNVGVIVGKHPVMTSLMLLIFQLSVNRPIPIVDQAVYNFIINTPIFQDDTLFTTNEDGWAIQLGTTEKAVASGAGDLGQYVAGLPSRMIEYKMLYNDRQPVIEKGEVGMTADSKDGKVLVPFVVVHQYDRIPELKKLIEEKYGDK